ncbi:peptide-methionine (S)-S-oxide reductase MsrA [Pontibacter silvestris]|uniref:Peptide methionine sulfoxide reductase MsrA n=1 Tax=Pontibacter silvestris TaxID=2305183 RepID=A0ABW4WXS0_9BACT|nr:peptide-methionine (S)-S-oxide reductase MsrA [Pontibacter silvestris]MCC9135350.1 peptide-methionine (S)-S-oxide reductase MsrA [Pontibacter silvestris]
MMNVMRSLSIFLPLFLLVASCTQAEGERQANTGEKNFLTYDSTDTTGLAKATFAGGCFWCTEGYFERLKGIKRVVSGYTGGTKANPTYYEVSAGETGHAEAVQIYYDPKLLSYRELLKAFFLTHDPTTLNRQGPDIGEQYRSAIFYHNQEQKKMAEQYIAELELSGKYQNKIVTQVEPFTKFWEAEEYHQDFYRRNPNNPYIESVAKPKMKKFENVFQGKLKGDNKEE